MAEVNGTVESLDSSRRKLGRGACESGEEISSSALSMSARTVSANLATSDEVMPSVEIGGRTAQWPTI